MALALMSRPKRSSTNSIVIAAAAKDSCNAHATPGALAFR